MDHGLLRHIALFRGHIPAATSSSRSSGFPNPRNRANWPKILAHGTAVASSDGTKVSPFPITSKMKESLMRIVKIIAVAVAIALSSTSAKAASPTQAKPDQVKPDQAKLVKPDQAKPDQVRPDQTKSGKHKFVHARHVRLKHSFAKSGLFARIKARHFA
jgi:hypothetical protein